MKILFFHIPSLGMYHAIQPILLELHRRGHEIVHYNEAGFRRYLEDAPIPFRHYPDYRGYFPSTCTSGMNLYELGQLLVETADNMADFVEIEIARASPDLVLHSKFMAAPKAMANKYGVPAVCLTTGFVFHPRTILEGKSQHAPSASANMAGVSSFLRFRRAANKWYEKFSAGKPDVDDIFVNDEPLNLVLSLDLFQPARSSLSANCKFVGPTVEMDAFEKAYELVYVSLGSVFANNRAFFEMCIEALAALPAPVLISLSNYFDPADFHGLPANIELQRFVRQKEILQRTAVFVTHGGDNSVAEAIYAAAPMVVVPQIPEQAFRAEQVERLNLGKSLAPDDLTVSSLRSTVAAVLHGAAFRTAMLAFRDTLPALPGGIAACDEIEQYAVRQQTRLVEK